MEEEMNLDYRYFLWSRFVAILLIAALVQEVRR